MAGEKGKQILKLRKESCLLSSLSAAKANPCWRESSCSCLQLMLGGLSPLGRFSWVCLNKQTNPWDERIGAYFPQPSSPLSFLPATSGIFSWPRWLFSVLKQRNRRHMLSAGSAAVLVLLPGRPCRGRALAPPPHSICTRLCAFVHHGRGAWLDSAGLYDFPHHL